MTRNLALDEPDITRERRSPGELVAVLDADDGLGVVSATLVEQAVVRRSREAVYAEEGILAKAIVLGERLNES
jgi:hypothetical protein